MKGEQCCPDFRSFQLRRLSELQVSELGEARYPAPGPLEEVWPLGPFPEVMTREFLKPEAEEIRE